MSDKNPRDFLLQFHQHAKRHATAVENKSIAEHNDQVKQKVVGILNKVKNSGPELEQLKQTNPKAYDSMMQLVQTMIHMAKDYVVAPHSEPTPQQEQPMQKAYPINRPIGSDDSGATASAADKRKHYVREPRGPEGVKKPRQMEAGVTRNPDTGEKLSIRKYKEMANKGQSAEDPQTAAMNVKH